MVTNSLKTKTIVNIRYSDSSAFQRYMTCHAIYWKYEYSCNCKEEAMMYWPAMYHYLNELCIQSYLCMLMY